MKKKLLASLLSVAMVVSLTACGGSEEATTEAPATEEAATEEVATEEVAEEEAAEETEEVAEEAAGEEKLTVWCWDPAFNINAMEKAAEVYKKDHPNFVLDCIETPWEDVQTKLTTAATSGQLDTLPDIILMQDNAFQKNVISYPDAFVDLTSTGIDFASFAPAKAAYSTVDGKNYGVPFDNGAAIACYRTDILEQAGYTIADFENITWEDYIEKGKVVLEKTGKPLLSCVGGETDVLVMMLQSAGQSFFNADGSTNIANNEELKTVMETYTELVKSGVLVEVNDWDQYIGTLNNETVAGTINGCWIMASIQGVAEQSGKWEITNLPKLTNLDGATNYSNNGGSSWAVTAGCKNVDLAADFLGATFGGSVELYENILETGAIATYLPAGESSMYGEPSEFFGGKPVFSTITEYAGQIPSVNTGVYYYEARDAVATAITNIINGGDVATELQAAEDTVNFAMGQ